MEGQCRPVRGEKQGCEGGRGEHRGDAERKGWGRQVCRGRRGLTHREVLASQATWEGGQASEGRTPHPSKSSPETYRPECKSWYASNSSWNFCSALYARMVQSPRREDAKWENTRLRAGEAETDTHQRKSGRLDARKPLPPGLWGHTSYQRESSMWPSNSCSHHTSLYWPGNERFSLKLSLIKFKIPARFR